MAGCKKEKSEISPGVKYDRVCRHCFAPIYRGSNHTDNACKSRRQALINVTAAVDNGKTSMDLVAGKYLKTLSSEVQSSTVGLKQSKALVAVIPCLSLLASVVLMGINHCQSQLWRSKVYKPRLGCLTSRCVKC